MNNFWYWLDDLWGERWAEEVENDPLSRKCRDLGNMIMSKPDPVRFIADLLGLNDEEKKDNQANSADAKNRAAD